MMLAKPKKSPVEGGAPIWFDKDLRTVFGKTMIKIINERQNPFISPSDAIKILIESYEEKPFEELLKEAETSAGQ